MVSIEICTYFSFYLSSIPGLEGYCPYLWCLSVHLFVHVCLGHCSETTHDNCLKTNQTYMEPMHCNLNLTFWLLTLILWPFPWQFSSDHFLETVNSNCFIFSGHINLTCHQRHCVVILIFVLDIVTFDFEILFTNSYLAQPRDIQCQCYI